MNTLTIEFKNKIQYKAFKVFAYIFNIKILEIDDEELEDRVLGEMIMEGKKSGYLNEAEKAKFLNSLGK